MDLRIGSATEVPFEAGTFDKITALECAFHFNTREKFFSEAFRALRPGGRLALADGSRWPGGSMKLGLWQRFAMKRWSVPLENMLYDRDGYCAKLEEHGFVNVSATSIREHVFPGCIKYKELREKGLSLQDAVIELTPDEISNVYGLKQLALTGFTDYVIFSADKPS
jgi:microcystin synthetase protein McyJ